MVVDNRAMGRRIKSARQRASMSQEHLAELVNLSTVHISNMESGSGTPSLNTLVNIANALAVSTDDILCDSILCAKPAFEKEILETTKDCNDYEIRVLSYMIKAAKAALREDKDFRQKMKEYEELKKAAARSV